MPLTRQRHRYARVAVARLPTLLTLFAHAAFHRAISRPAMHA